MTLDSLCQGMYMTRPRELVDFKLAQGTPIKVLHGNIWWNAVVVRGERHGEVKIGYVNGRKEDEEIIRVAEQPYRIRRSRPSNLQMSPSM
jgi:hypothetical protein